MVGSEKRMLSSWMMSIAEMKSKSSTRSVSGENDGVRGAVTKGRSIDVNKAEIKVGGKEVETETITWMATKETTEVGIERNREVGTVESKDVGREKEKLCKQKKKTDEKQK